MKWPASRRGADESRDFDGLDQPSAGRPLAVIQTKRVFDARWERLILVNRRGANFTYHVTNRSTVFRVNSVRVTASAHCTDQGPDLRSTVLGRHVK